MQNDAIQLADETTASQQMVCLEKIDILNEFDVWHVQYKRTVVVVIYSLVEVLVLFVDSVQHLIVVRNYKRQSQM